MTESVSLPLWLAAVVFVLAAVALVERLLAPGVKWLVRRRVNRVLDEVDARLSIRIQPFKLTKRQVLVDRLLNDPAVLEAVETAVREEGLPHDRVFARAATYAEEVVPAFNAYVYFRVGYWIARQVARALYRVRLGSEDALGEVPEGSTVVFLMNHRSNMDYVLVSYLVAEKTALSYAVGEWARVWPLQTLFRAMGAYFIRRDSRSPLYRKVLERYVAMATAAGVTQAVYPEGGLTRDGRLRPPRLGILDYMVRSFDPSGRDLVFVPVGLNYDRVLEDRTLLRDLDPAAAKPGATRAALATLAFAGKNLALLARNRWRRFGYACVHLGRPVSLSKWLAERGLDPRTLPPEERRARVADLAFDLMDAIARVVPVLPVPLVATLFARERDRGFTELELKAGVLRLAGELSARGARVHVPRRDLDYAITVGLRMLVLRHSVVEADGLYRAAPGEVLLDYYAGSVAHLLPPLADARSAAVTANAAPAA
jgi:glycerol-3-phosphate O-acyltransferase